MGGVADADAPALAEAARWLRSAGCPPIAVGDRSYRVSRGAPKNFIIVVRKFSPVAMDV